MAANTPTPEELDLRRRARRRLIGAIALALLVIVVLPMLFEPEPKPLGEDVDIRIPGQDTPFQAAVAPPAAMPEQKPAAVEPVPPPVVAANPAPKPAVPAEALKPAPAKVEPAKPAPAKVEPTVKDEKPSKPESKPAEKPAAKKDEAKPSAAGYNVQVGVFGNEQNAKQLVDKLSKAGYKARVIHANGQSRVWVGPYADKPQVQEAQSKLKAKGYTPVLIAP